MSGTSLPAAQRPPGPAWGPRRPRAGTWSGSWPRVEDDALGQGVADERIAGSELPIELRLGAHEQVYRDRRAGRLVARPRRPLRGAPRRVDSTRTTD